MKSTLKVSLVIVFLVVNASASAHDLKVPLTVTAGKWETVPVTTGVPLPEGSIADPADLRLLGPDGTTVPLQTRTLSVWPDGSVRWVLLDFQANADASAGIWTLTEAPEAAPAPAGEALRVEETERSIRVDTGPLQFAVSKDHFNGIEDVKVDERRIIPPNHDGGSFLDLGEGRVSLSRLTPTEVVVEEQGPLRAVVRTTASYQSPDGVTLDFALRITAYAGKRFVRLDHTFTNRTGQVIRLKELTMEYPFTGAFDRFASAGDGESVIRGDLGQKDVRLVQSLDHRFGSYASHRFQVLRGEEEVARGSRSEGWMSLAGTNGNVTVAVRDFWESYPKGLRASGHRFAVELWPKGALPEPAGQMDINAGAAKTHQVLLSFSSDPADIERARTLAEWLDRPPLALASPAWYASTAAAAKGALSPAVVDGEVAHPEYEAWVNWMVQEKYLDRRVERDEYGMMHFGDYLLGGDIWNSLQYDLPRSFMQQFFRTGDRRFFDLAAEMAKNQRDVLVLWHLDVTKGRRTHRRYGGDPSRGEPHGRADSGEPQQSIGGMVDHYLMTGDRRTLEAILFVADGIANVRGNELNWFRYGNWRAAGYPLTILADAYRLTRDEKYREAAVRILKECVFPRAHTVDHGFPEAIADGVWWFEPDRGGAWRVDPDASRWEIQAWQIDPMGDGLYSVYEILEDGPVKERLRETFLAVADFAVEHAWNSERGGLNVWVRKDREGNYTAEGLYDGFISMLAVSTMARAYELTGDRRYLDTGKEMYRAAVADRSGVVEAKQVGQSMEYAPIFIEAWDEAAGIRP